MKMMQQIRGLALAFLRTSKSSSFATPTRVSPLVALVMRQATVNPRPFTRCFASTAARLTTMEKLVPLDQLSVTVIVDNESDTMSSAIRGVEGFQYWPQKKRGPPYKDPSLCSAGHGLSLLLQAQVGDDNVQTLLLDAGPSPNLWKNNMESLGIDPGIIDTAVLSHYHWDHSGGLRGAVPLVAKAKRSTVDPLVVDLQSDAIVSRGRPMPDQSVEMHEPDNPTASELTTLGARVQFHEKDHTVGQDFFYVSGYIPRLNDFETGFPGHVTLRHGKWMPDSEIADERYVACHVKNRGLVVFSACSHAGINNVCRDALHKASDNRLFGIMGGLHLAGAQVEGRISRTIGDLKELDPSVVLAGHCTGWRAKAQLAAELDGNFQPISVGCTYKFTSQ